MARLMAFATWVRTIKDYIRIYNKNAIPMGCHRQPHYQQGQ